jgi:cellulose synthase/poly-beta-1,6-N-acetylglucosamine synthase-like glycosyltransferase
MSVSSMLLLFLASSPVKRFVAQLFDKTFVIGKGGKPFYHLNTFDTVLLIPYFAVLVILAAYGLHRYWLVFTYFRYRKNRLGPPARNFEKLPRVTIQLPIYNERFVVDRLVESACRVDYPRELLDIQLLDDSTDETVEVARACVERFAAMGHPIVYLHRDNREGFKAGALAEGLRTAKGEFIAIFDADFVIPTDFLQRAVHYFTDPGIGMLQTRWTFLNRDYSFLTRVQATLLDGHFVLEHGARARAGCFFNFNGTAGIWRLQAIEEGGGWQHDTLTEDTDLSYRSQMKGWRFLYLPDIECPSELPVEINAFKTQQARWAKGLIQTSMKILPRLFRSKAPFHVKAEAWFHLTANIAYPFMIVLSTLLMPAMIVRFYQGWFQMLYIDLPLFMASTFSISSFYLTSQRELRPKTWMSTFKYLPFLMAVGIGIGVSNSRAVLEALFGVHSSFQRTAKYKLDGDTKKARPKVYRRAAGWIPLVELAIGTFFLGTVAYGIESRNFATVPFLVIFVLGYYYIGLMSMFQTPIENLTNMFRRRSPDVSDLTPIREAVVD